METFSSFKIFNPEYIISISDNNLKFIEEIYSIYCLQGAEILKLIKNAVNCNDINVISIQAHKLKSSFNIIGLTNSIENICILEDVNKIKTEQIEIISILKKIEEDYILSKDEFHIFIQKLKEEKNVTN
jgi:hypothetical protein